MKIYDAADPSDCKIICMVGYYRVAIAWIRTYSRHFRTGTA